MQKVALLSVSDRTGLDSFARHLDSCGFKLLATSGTLKFLKEIGINGLSIEDYTGQKEILEGRVKTLHPKIHAGLLAKKDNPLHLEQLKGEGIMPIDIAVINLYPFIQNLSGEAAQNPDKMIELVDIGGPTMIRASAKNYKSVLPVIDPADYPGLEEYITADGLRVPLEVRRRLATKVFTRIAHYNLEIAKYFSSVSYDTDGTVSVDSSSEFTLSETSGQVLSKSQSLRYGENPHQKAVFYRDLGSAVRSWEQLQGKELSYNNLLDFDAALRLIRLFRGGEQVVAILKHLNPCGVAADSDQLAALKKAKQGDPRSHFGGILAFNHTVAADAAQDVAEDFAEIVLAPDYAPEALEIFKRKKNLRVIKVSLDGGATYEYRSVEGGMLVQEIDRGVSNVREAQVMSQRKPSEQELRDLDFVWRVCAHVKSNAIVLAKDRMLLGTGAGQMSRIDAAEVALSKALFHRHDLSGAVAASDAFFPFPDTLEVLANRGVRAIVAPSGSKADKEVIAAADRLAVSLLFVGDRHFRH